tara:strand:- start:7603 stop:8616 length:1014 start_codon:yes stop_codon:yes gene_type:complete
MPTISDVAQRAGVSTKTVSRVMNNYEHISTKTREKVERAIEELNFLPGFGSPVSRIGESLSIGMLYGDPSSGYQARLNHAVLKACSDARRYLAVELFDEKNVDWRHQVEDFLDRTGVKNMILVPPMCDSSDLHELLRERGVRHVLISPSRPVSGDISIVMDEFRASREITNHIIELGHRRIGHISGHPDHVATMLRRQGFEEAMAKAGLANKDNMIVASGRFRFRAALERAEEMLSSPNRPTAIFAANDEMASAVVMAANRLGLRVPEDLSVAGFDDAPIASVMWPDLTTIAQPFEKIGQAAVNAFMKNRPSDESVSETIVLPHRLVVRASTGPVKK